MSRRRLGLRKRLALNIFSDLYSSTVAEHRLDTLFWECTLRCNLSCRHCGSDCRVDPGVRDMPIEDFLKVLDEEITPHVDPSEVLIIFSGGEVLVPGMTFTIEPMLNLGKRDIKELGKDGWTIITKDRSLSAQWEHTVLVTETGYEVLTLSAGSPPLPPFVQATRT